MTSFKGFLQNMNGDRTCAVLALDAANHMEHVCNLRRKTRDEME